MHYRGASPDHESERSEYMYRQTETTQVIASINLVHWSIPVCKLRVMWISLLIQSSPQTSGYLFHCILKGFVL